MRSPVESWQTRRALYEELRRLGIGVFEVAVISTNADARRFYERHDVLPFMVTYLGKVPTAARR